MDSRRYEESVLLGEGTYGAVYKARDAERDCLVAIKHVKTERGTFGLPPTTLREIAVLKELHHDNIVRLDSVAIDFPARGKISLVFEHLDADLFKHIQEKPEQCRSKTMEYMYQILAGLAHCHARRVLHRDIKPANILLDRASDTLKLGDFGLARPYGIDIGAYTHEVVTLWYRPPEILLGAKKYGSSTDVWSVGCIFAELARGKNGFLQGSSELDQLHKIFKVLGTPAPTMKITALREFKNLSFPNHLPSDLAAITGLSATGVDLLKKMLHYDPSRRISAADALQHPYFMKMRYPRPRHPDPAAQPCGPSEPLPPSKRAKYA
jgi:cyclin-dependent kinase 2